MTCASCGYPTAAHCGLHLIPCCPGKCPGPDPAALADLAAKLDATAERGRAALAAGIANDLSGPLIDDFVTRSAEASKILAAIVRHMRAAATADPDADPLRQPAAMCGTGVLSCAVWRAGDPLKHLGHPGDSTPAWSARYTTRCGIRAGQAGTFVRCGDPARDPLMSAHDDDYWCPPCLRAAHIDHRLWTDDDEENDANAQAMRAARATKRFAQ